MMRYLSCAETAKLVRAALKQAFPGQKFSVRSRTYAGGASIDVSWTDGPQSADVDVLVTRYAGAGFDGMIDLKTLNHDWLYPDGHVESFQSEIGHSYGSTTRDLLGSRLDDPETARDYRAGARAAVGQATAGRCDETSLAYRAGFDDAKLRVKQGAELVHFGADYIFTQRDLSPGLRERLEHAVAYLAGEDAGSFDPGKRYAFGLRVGGRWFEEYGSTLVHQISHVAGDEIEAALRREAERRSSRPGPVGGAEVDGRRLHRVATADGGTRLQWQ